ncbi:CHY zinc finger protein [Tenuibacillus multivorans]|uniref:Uncharacterized protein, contains Zn-finger domain of CHY type n=1 Tax=Tenuibacillus multivorans TaxID=237069 RepID=A0A1H0AMD1_9BACI|nr:CHY zinc finger protein [Tenuibacillus multivorans]SDN34444.1 Uncharacterized protein, contains Zn-finger domain of CHY type [Tenuibacillus multivorans]
MFINGIQVKGQVIDEQTRCSHYHTQHDIIAIKFKCCNTYHPCYKCHQETGHAIERWKPAEFNEEAILCGACKTELTINEYLHSPHQCPNCHASFNPGCELHHHLYFAL